MTSISQEEKPSTFFKKSKPVADLKAKPLRVCLQRSNERLMRIKNGETLAKITRSQSQNALIGDRINLLANETSGHESSRVESNKITGDKEAVLSELTRRYHKERSFNPEVVEDKEKNLLQYFKEKLQLMGLYIGDNILNSLFKAQPRMRQDEISTEEELLAEDMIEAKDKPLIAIVRQDTYKNKLDATALAKILKTNRDIAVKILKEEHENKMKKLNDLQVEQNMNLLDDDSKVNFGEGKGPFSTFNQRSKLPKVILKPNFLSKNWFRDVLDEMNEEFMKGFRKSLPNINETSRISPIKAERASVSYSEMVRETLEKNMNLSEIKVVNKEVNKPQDYIPFVSLKEVCDNEMARFSPSPKRFKNKDESAKSYLTLKEAEIKSLMNDNDKFLNETKAIESKEIKGVKVKYYGEPIRSKLIIINETPEKRTPSPYGAINSDDFLQTSSSGDKKFAADKSGSNKIDQATQSRSKTPQSFKKGGGDSRLEPIVEETHLGHEESSMNVRRSGITSRAASRTSIENAQMLPKEMLFNDSGSHNALMPKFGRSKSVNKHGKREVRGREVTVIHSSILPKINQLELNVVEQKNESWTITKSIRGQTDKYWTHTNEQL